MPAERASVEMHGGPDYVAPEKNLRKKLEIPGVRTGMDVKRETGTSKKCWNLSAELSREGVDRVQDDIFHGGGGAVVH